MQTTTLGMLTQYCTWFALLETTSVKRYVALHCVIFTLKCVSKWYFFQILKTAIPGWLFWTLHLNYFMRSSSHSSVTMVMDSKMLIPLVKCCIWAMPYCYILPLHYVYFTVSWISSIRLPLRNGYCCMTDNIAILPLDIIQLVDVWKNCPQDGQFCPSCWLSASLFLTLGLRCICFSVSLRHHMTLWV